MSDLVVEAERFAKERHQGQRYGQVPYSMHLEEVVAWVKSGLSYDTVLREYEGHVLAVAWLHDVVEDTVTVREDLAERFGVVVADAVHACTGFGANRKERVEEVYRRYGCLGDSLPGQICQFVKLCDRLANVEACWKDRDRRLFMYAAEHPEFRRRLGLDQSIDPAIQDFLQHLDGMVGFKPCA